MNRLCFTSLVNVTKFQINSTNCFFSVHSNPEGLSVLFLQRTICNSSLARASRVLCDTQPSDAFRSWWATKKRVNYASDKLLCLDSYRRKSLTAECKSGQTRFHSRVFVVWETISETIAFVSEIQEIHGYVRHCASRRNWTCNIRYTK